MLKAAWFPTGMTASNRPSCVRRVHEGPDDRSHRQHRRRKLSGARTDGVTRFLGVPYAAAPAGDSRFAPPRPAERWEGTRDATEYGATAPQPGLHPAHTHLAPLIGPGWVTGDGHYLNLNVWTPDPGTSGLPVMVYVHGGGFMIGSGSAPAFDGTAFARDGVVLVTVNYRLGDHAKTRPKSEARRGQAATRPLPSTISSVGGDVG